MTETRISDIIEPEVFNRYMLEETIKNSSLIRSGIVIPDPELDVLAAAGGRTINMPFFKDLGGDSEVLAEGSALQVNAVTAGQDIARLHFRGKAWGSNDLAASIAGADPMAAIALRVATFWAYDEQKTLINSLVGVFTDNVNNDSNDLVHQTAAEATGDIVQWNGSSPTVMNPVAIIDGESLLGDAQEKFVAIMMHSKCFGDLKKQELIDYVQPSGVSTKIPLYLDKEVIVNDSCPRRDGTTSGTNTVYQSFLFGMGAIGRGEGSPKTPIETDRTALEGSDILITRRHYILHPRGIAWTDSAIAGMSPTFLEMAEAAQWSRVYEQKNIRIAMIETN